MDMCNMVGVYDTELMHQRRRSAALLWVHEPEGQISSL